MERLLLIFLKFNSFASIQDYFSLEGCIRCSNDVLKYRGLNESEGCPKNLVEKNQKRQNISFVILISELYLMKG